jgi:predicted  nucleic acid-binding Zn-ribbon protein
MLSPLLLKADRREYEFLWQQGGTDMSFNYHKNKDGHGGNDSFWTSYSDLFLGLSAIFLLLYVTASLRTGTDALRSQVENQQLSQQVQELKNQLSMYENVKNEYMEKTASKDEQQEYQELMDKLTLLQEESKSEKDRLVKEAQENDSKAKALNKYQQMVRNVMNSNKMAKAKIINRDDLIKDQDVEIEQKQQQIGTLQQDINQKTQLIAQGEAQIRNTRQALSDKMAQLQKSLKHQKITQKFYQQKTAELKKENDKKLMELNGANAQYQQQLQASRGQLNGLKNQLDQAQGELSNVQNQLGDTKGQLAQTQGQLGNVKGQLGEAQEQLGTTKGQLAQTQGQLGAVKGQLGAVKGQLNQAHGALAAKEGEANNLKGQLGATQAQLAKARQELEARKNIANEIQKGFAKAGVKAEIDMETGDVVLDFGQQYFDSDSDRLKQQMKAVLEKAMPVYSKSLFGNPNVAQKISAVEIIGFASPTYKGKFIDPKSSKPEDKTALKYNMDLSYRRANSIFSYLLDDGNVNFAHQKELLGLMKVSGRSFLEVMSVKNRNVATAQEFCKQNDCKKAQRVIVRFSMDQKK